MHRLFVAIRPPGEVRDALIDIMEGVPGLRWQDDDQLHLTLRFVGEVEPRMAEDLARALATIRFDAFAVAIAGLGRFDRRRSGALWAGVEPKERLKALAAKVERQCQESGLEPERRAYHPHITLARWSGAKPILEPFIERHAGLRSAPFTVDGFTLFETHLGRDGVHYEPVADYSLAATT